MTVGEKLRQARLEQGLSLIEVQEQTKLPIQNLEAIEKDNYDALGSDYNIKTLIFAYAKLLGIDGKALAEQYMTGEDKEEEAEDVQKLETRQMRTNSKAKNDKGIMKIIPIIILTFVLLLIIGSVAYAFIKENNRFNAGSDVQKTYEVEDHTDAEGEKESKEEAPKEESKAPEVVTSSSKEAEMKIETLSNTGSQVTMKATDVKGNAEFTLTGSNGRCWVSVTANGQSLYQGIVEMGATQKVSLPANTKQVSIRTGNAPALDISLNGKDINYHANSTLKQITLMLNLEYLN